MSSRNGRITAAAVILLMCVVSAAAAAARLPAAQQDFEDGVIATTRVLRTRGVLSAELDAASSRQQTMAQGGADLPLGSRSRMSQHRRALQGRSGKHGKTGDWKEGKQHGRQHRRQDGDDRSPAKAKELHMFWPAKPVGPRPIKWNPGGRRRLQEAADGKQQAPVLDGSSRTVQLS